MCKYGSRFALKLSPVYGKRTVPPLACQASAVPFPATFSERLYRWVRNEVSELLGWSPDQLPLWTHREAFEEQDPSGTDTEHRLSSGDFGSNLDCIVY